MRVTIRPGDIDDPPTYVASPRRSANCTGTVPQIDGVIPVAYRRWAINVLTNWLREGGELGHRPERTNGVAQEASLWHGPEHCRNLSLLGFLRHPIDSQVLRRRLRQQFGVLAK